MARELRWLLGASIAVACALPKIEVDPTLDQAAGTTGGAGGASGGRGGTTGGGGSAGKGLLSGKGGVGPLMNGGQGGAVDDPRELACIDYCATYLKNCLTSPANTYDDSEDCLNTCFSSDWPLGTDETQKNSLQCRQVHARLARDNPNPHCFHSAELPTGTSCAL
jgi:hypothetical protein